MKRLGPVHGFGLQGALLGIALAVGVFGLYMVATLLDKGTLIPKASERFDVRSLQVAALSAVCPEASRPLTVEAMEGCVARLERGEGKGAFGKIAIPSPDQVLDQPIPRFMDLLDAAGHADVARAIRAREPYVIGVDVPATYFTPEVLGKEPYVLVFYKITDARFCVAGKCGFHSDKNEYLAISVPLFGNLPPEAKSSTVWIMAHDPLGAIGLYLRHGLFVTKNSRLGLARRFLPLAYHGMPVIFVLIFIALTLAAMGFALLWRDRFCYTAFVYFCASMAALVAPTEYILGPFYWDLSLGIRDTVTFWKVANLPVASLLLAFAALEVRRKIVAWAFAVIEILILAASAWVSFTQEYEVVGPLWINTVFVSNWIAAILPLLAFAYKAWDYWRAHDDGDFLAKEERRQGIVRNVIFFACALPLGVQLAWYGTDLWLGQLGGSSTPAPWVAVGLFFMLAVAVYDTALGLRRRLAISQQKLRDTAHLQAVAATTQMLAHDVRRPFSTMKIGLDLIADMVSDPIAQDWILRLKQETEANLKSVNGMIEDILAVGREEVLELKSESPVHVVKRAIDVVFTSQRESRIDLAYDFRHTHMVACDPSRLERVTVNILDNAVAAMKRQGTCRFSTAMRTVQGKPFVLFSFQNDGSYIAPENRERVFSALYTAGKRGGTGLGLAIARKIIDAHGGSIWCDSSETDGTTFHFLIPASTQADYTPTTDLPRASEEVGRWNVPQPLRRRAGASSQRAEGRSSLNEVPLH